MVGAEPRARRGRRGQEPERDPAPGAAGRDGRRRERHAPRNRDRAAQGRACTGAGRSRARTRARRRWSPRRPREISDRDVLRRRAAKGSASPGPQNRYRKATKPPTMAATSTGQTALKCRSSTAVDRRPEPPEQRREAEEPRPAGEDRQDDEPEQVVAREARRDGHELVGDRRQAFQQDDPVAVLGIGRAEGLRALVEPVELEQPCADRIVEQRADRVAEQGRRPPRSACRRGRRTRPAPAAPAPSAPASRRAAPGRTSFRRTRPRRAHRAAAGRAASDRVQS